jgi:hypothetical protein
MAVGPWEKLKRVFGKTAPPPAIPDQYAHNEQTARDGIALSTRLVPKLLGEGNFVWAAKNHAMIAEGHTDLGMLHWRRGHDPRPDFESAILAFENLRYLVQEHGLDKHDHEFPLVYAMLSLMGRRMPIEFEDAAYHAEHRWPCYQSCLVHCLHDRPLDARHASLLDQYLSENDELPDRSFLTYFQLLGVRSSGQSRDELVQAGEASWRRRKTDSFFSDAGYINGHGVMNDLYVDIFLAAVLKKIGWQGQSIHKWMWG